MAGPSVRLSPRTGRVLLCIERLEDRSVASAGLSDEVGPFVPTVMAGDPKFTPSQPDTPAARVDKNTAESPFAGVGSLQVLSKFGTFTGTATAIGDRYILTAAHVVDLNNDGKVDAKDGLKGAYFILNSGKDQSHKIAVARFDVNPDFTGFNNPSIHDDLAVLTLADDLPDGLPIYPLPHYDMLAGEHITIVGYGRSGTGTGGYSTAASLTVKRVGENMVDAFYGQDDKNRPFANEVFRFDFDFPDMRKFGPLGGPTVGPNRETTLGPGDSGGPSFGWEDGRYVLAGVNTFVQGATAPRFGSMAGGVNVYPYIRWINSIVYPEPEIAMPAAPGGSFIFMPAVPGLGPATTVPASVGSIGIKVGATKVSDAVAIDGLAGAGRTAGAARPSWAAEDWRGSSSAEPEAADTDARPGWLSGPAFRADEPLAFADFLSVDTGLLTLVGGETLTLDS